MSRNHLTNTGTATATTLRLRLHSVAARAVRRSTWKQPLDARFFGSRTSESNVTGHAARLPWTGSHVIGHVARLHPAAGVHRVEPAESAERMTGWRPAEPPGPDAGGPAGRCGMTRVGPTGDGIGKEGCRRGESPRRGPGALVTSNKTAHRTTDTPRDFESNRRPTAGRRWP